MDLSAAEMPGWVTPVTLIVIAGLGGLAKLIHWMGQVDGHRKGVDEHRESVLDFLAEIRGDIKRILLRLSPVIETGSPVRLNDLGRRVAAEINADEWARRVAPDLVSEVEDLKAFQVDHFCRTYVNARAFDAMTEESRDRVTSSAYKQGIDRSAVQDILYVALRNELLKRLGLPLE